jgi:hypothetical protein
LGELEVDGKIILKAILKKYCVRLRTEFMWLTAGSGGGIL